MKKNHKAVDFDAIIIGAGFAGLYMLYKLRSYGFSAHIYEKAPGVGGTWFWNKYPGARCDTESLQYSYQFSEQLQQDWDWSEKYATQPEILNYLNFVAEKFNLKKSIDLNTTITNLRYDEQEKIWEVSNQKNQKTYCKFCILATGCLSVPLTPKIKGLYEFNGEIYQTSLWPDKEIDFKNKNIAILGTGSSGIHVIPIVAKQCKELYVLQRTPNYAVPAHNMQLPEEYIRNFKKNYKENREKAKKLVSGFLTEYNTESALEVNKDRLKSEYDKRWAAGGLAFLAAFKDITYNKKANETATDYIENKIQEIVNDKKVAEQLKPKSVVGCKRLVIDTDYYKTFNRKNVKLIDINTNPLKKLTKDKLKLKSSDLNIDMLILATGFDAITGAINNINIEGKNKIKLKDKWQNGPKSYLGLSVNGFPNLFTITGPGSPSVLTNMIPTIEQHVNWIADCMLYMKKEDFNSLEATIEAENLWVDYNESCAKNTLRYNCNSWYLGSNVKNKQRIFLPFVGGLPTYIEKCEEIVLKSYEGFSLK